MAKHGYESGRLNLPFVGHCTFAKSPICTDWNAIDADVAILGAPNDMGTQWRSGARFGPRGIREASTLFSFGHAGAYDFEDDATYLTDDQLRMVDVGDADIVHTDMATSNANIESAVRQILKAGAMPVVLGGDHSIHAPVIKASYTVVAGVSSTIAVSDVATDSDSEIALVLYERFGADFLHHLRGEFAGVIADRSPGPALRNGDRMPGATWFAGTRLNFAENLLRGTGSGQDRPRSARCCIRPRKNGRSFRSTRFS